MEIKCLLLFDPVTYSWIKKVPFTVPNQSLGSLDQIVKYENRR